MSKTKLIIMSMVVGVAISAGSFLILPQTIESRSTAGRTEITYRGHPAYYYEKWHRNPGPGNPNTMPSLPEVSITTNFYFYKFFMNTLLCCGIAFIVLWISWRVRKSYKR